MKWIRRHALLLLAAAAALLLAAGLRLSPADRLPGVGWMLIVWSLAIVAGAVTARRGRSGSRNE
ncbi:hypothetical protein Q5424_16190 [Conexibacter sp. JD483]|uniref:hypothetical protein n=1 Tax=unclassified Conexibacter TaxID=2627773 RepID=UPI00272907F0|nr:MULTISPECIES: hypothetical protein [unclassified Conexibacter]MDO8187290.1 hypothetical protein [Conexibacter sp. CPCC 205706]MDO8198899.1 hypothetical protein [Conexibacter sp. CPCC 205762]MDR9370638.1 hypothetical protein [Conexibacter sp. JD483]